LGESGEVSRFEALRSGETPVVGREEEIELLGRRWEQAKSGEGRVVLISGEPGIGKSRLTAALSAQIESEPHTRLRYFCSPHPGQRALSVHRPARTCCRVFRRRYGRRQARQTAGTARPGHAR
jgi:predicted ATPase